MKALEHFAIITIGKWNRYYCWHHYCFGRASNRLRNPANASPEWVSPVLQTWLAASAEREPQFVELADNRLGYIEPILLKPLCLTCHGSNLPAEITARINELYAEDQATGFEAGDLRGVFWIEFPAGQ